MKRQLGMLSLLGLTILAPIAWAAPTFAPKVDYTTGTTPEGVAIGDLNRDGIPDLVVANLASTTVSVLLGLGGGTFAAKVDYATGTAPFGVTLGDLNRDGKLDVVVANLAAATLSTYLGNGDGTLTAKVDFGTANRPYMAAISDVNMDGIPDLVASCEQAPGAVSVILNGTPAGTPVLFMSPKTDFPTGGNASSIAVADFDRDGLPDLAVSKAGVNSVATLKGFGDGTFDAPVDFATANTPQKVVAADLNQDGKVDLASASSAGSLASVLMGDGAGGFGPRTNFTTAGTGSAALAAGDFTGDAKLDLAVVNAGAPVVAVLVNTTTQGSATPTFLAHADFATGTGPIAVALGDLDLTGKLDIVTANSTATSASVLLSNIVCGLTDVTTETPTDRNLWLSASPNPSSSRTSITFAMPTAGPAKIEIFDVNGRKLRQWEFSALSPGEHHVEWNGVDDTGRLVPPSVLFYNLQAAGRIVSQKITRMN